MPAILFPYSSTSTLYFALIGSATAAHSTAGSGSLTGTNIRVSIDGGAWASSTNTGTVVGNGFYKVVLTDTELAGKQILVDIAGSGAVLGTLVEAQAFLIHTYGSASALYTFLGAGSAGTPLVNLVANQSTATIGTVTFLASGTITTALNTLIANVTQVSGTNVTATGGRPEVNISHWLGTAAAGTQGVPSASANIIQVLSTAVTGTNGTLVVNAGGLTGTVDANVVNWKGTAVAGTQGVPSASANIIQILSTAVVATAGTLTNIGTAGLVLSGTVGTVTGVVSADLRQILGTTAVGTSGTLTNVGTITTVASANVVQVLGTAVTGSNGTLVVNAGGLTGTIDANVIQVLATAVTGTGGRMEVNLSHWKGTAVAGTTGTPLVNLVADQTTATVGTVSFVATGTVTYAGTVGTVTGTVGVNILAINGTALAASLLAQSLGAITSGSATGTRSSTAFEVSGFTSTATDQYKGRIVLFISGTMQFQASDVTASRGSAVGTLVQLTVTTLTGTPADGVTFVLV